MLNGVLIAYGIILASLPIPIVHFVAVPISPFAAGFIGGGVAKADEGKVIVFGLIVGGLALIPTIALLILALGFDVSLYGLNKWLVVIVAAVLPLYTWWGVTVGALISFLFRKKEQERAGQQPAAVSSDSSSD